MFLGSTFKYLMTCSINFPPGSIANLGFEVVPDVVHRIASWSPDTLSIILLYLSGFFEAMSLPSFIKSSMSVIFGSSNSLSPRLSS